MARGALRRFSIGLDYGTESARGILVDTADGRCVAEVEYPFRLGRNGVILGDDPHVARQHPVEYERAAEFLLKTLIQRARRAVRGFSAEQIVGIGVDATGSTPIPIDASGKPVAYQKQFARDPAAMAWLWKDHTSVAEAEEITALARKMRPAYLKNCGGAYSSEWFWAKILHCRRTAPRVFDAAHLWVECADWIPALLTGQTTAERLKIGICAAGHKGLFDARWGGYPDGAFLRRLNGKLGALRGRLPNQAGTIADACGGLTAAWAKRTGIPAGTPVAMGAIDAHLGAVGAGIKPGTLVKIIGTSTCDMLVADCGGRQPDVSGLCGIVRGSIVPGLFGFEAGQAAVGDVFNWFVREINPGGAEAGSHAALTRAAWQITPGQSGLLALDWLNGNRSVLTDSRLSGLMVGQTLATKPAEIYRALIEATAFGALMIIRRIEECGQSVRQVVNCGGIAEKSPLLMQIYADVLGREMQVSAVAQTCALGAAIAGATVGGAHDGIASAQMRMAPAARRRWRPQSGARRVYGRLFKLYEAVHDAFGIRARRVELSGVMKELLEIRRSVSAPRA